MTQYFNRIAILGGAALALAATLPVSAAPVSVVAPNALESSPGTAQGVAPFRFFGSGGSRSQVVYSAAFFQSTGPLLITEIFFRPFPGFTPSAFFGPSLNVSSVNVSLSTTARLDETGTPLSATYATNIGADVQTVYSGALVLTTAATGTPVRDFDYRIALQTPFAYDPTLGNLLLDVMIPSSATVSGTGFGFGTFDNANTLADGVYSVVDINNGDATTGFAATDGAIARFVGETGGVIDPTVIPVPAGLPLLLSGLAAFGFLFKRRGD